MSYQLSVTMLHIVALVCLATACLGTPLPDGKIVGGGSVNIQQYPYQLSMQTGRSHSCGASIISANWAVTAAHCAGGSVGSIFLRAGSSIRESGGTVHQVSQKIVHSRYSSNNQDYDIALLRVSTPFSFGSAVAAVALPQQDASTPTGSSAVVSGWGATSEGGGLPFQLQAISVPIVSTSECQSAYGSGTITARMICAGIPQGGKDSCQGDSGGPLVAGGKLVGVVSWGYGCARPSYPGVYTRVASLRTWIQQNSGV